MSRSKSFNLDNNDTFTVGQTNEMVDTDFNLNTGSLFQKGLFNATDVDQDIDSGENSQSNESMISDYGIGFGDGASDNDSYSIFQGNRMDDSDFNVNDGSLFQAGVFNLAGVEQDIDSGENEQSNHSGIVDTGEFDGHGARDKLSFHGNDEFSVEQTNFMIDTDANANLASFGQFGFFNAGGVDQEIDSGENEQSNSSWIDDYSGGAEGYDDNDAFQVSQASLMADADENGNLVDAGQFGALNGGWFDQDITSGGNSQENTSEIFDFGV